MDAKDGISKPEAVAPTVGPGEANAPKLVRLLVERGSRGDTIIFAEPRGPWPSVFYLGCLFLFMGYRHRDLPVLGVTLFTMSLLCFVCGLTPFVKQHALIVDLRQSMLETVNKSFLRSTRSQTPMAKVRLVTVRQQKDMVMPGLGPCDVFLYLVGDAVLHLGMGPKEKAQKLAARLSDLLKVPSHFIAADD